MVEIWKVQNWDILQFHNIHTKFPKVYGGCNIPPDGKATNRNPVNTNKFHFIISYSRI